jgi:hypothetical protein
MENEQRKFIQGVIMRQVIGEEIFYSYLPDDGSFPERERMSEVGDEVEWKFWSAFFQEQKGEAPINSGVNILRMNADFSGSVALFPDNPNSDITYSLYSRQPASQSGLADCMKREERRGKSHFRAFMDCFIQQMT